MTRTRSLLPDPRTGRFPRTPTQGQRAQERLYWAMSPSPWPSWHLGLCDSRAYEAWLFQRAISAATHPSFENPPVDGPPFPRFPRSWEVYRRIRRPFKPIRMEPKPTAYADWYCEADTVGITTTHCSPGNPIHRSPCGWMS